MKTMQQFPAWFSKQRPAGKLVIGCGTVFILFCLCAFSVAVLSPGTSNARAASSSGDVSNIQTTAIDTMAAPTSTVSSFSTPTIEPTAAPELYIISMSDKFPAYVDALLDMIACNREASDDPSLLLSTEWKRKQGVALGILELRADEIAQLQPSPKYTSLHSIIVELATETHLFSSAYTKGIDNLDVDLINLASQHMEKINSLMKEATAELKRIESNP